MKKRALAIAFLLASLISPVQAEEKNGWYLGTKMGWSHFNPLKYYMNNSQLGSEDFSIDSISAPILGVFLGYDFNSYLGLEIENNTHGFFPQLMFQKDKKYIQSNSVQIATKLSYPITDNFHIYTRLGGTMLWDDLASKETLKTLFSEESPLLPSVSLGVEYLFNGQFITRLDYNWKNSVKNIVNSSIKPSLGDAVLSIGWNFGKSNIDNIFSSHDPESFNTQYSVLNESINFPFNSTEIKPISYDKLNKLDNDLKNMKWKNLSIILLGHSDRIGNQEYNQKLSEDRAYSIKNYLTSRGFSRDKITVQGMRDLYPLTNQVCKDIANRALLVSCLAPDRRVEIEVLSDIE